VQSWEREGGGERKKGLVYKIYGWAPVVVRMKEKYEERWMRKK
jgi:hypothetical protein